MDMDSWPDIIMEFMAAIAALFTAAVCLLLVGYTFFYEPMSNNYAKCGTVFLCEHQTPTIEEAPE